MNKERYIKEIKQWIQHGNSIQDQNAEQKLQGHLLDYAYDLERAELISFIQISFNYQVPKTVLSENISLIQSLQPSLTNFGTIGENCLYIWVQALKPHLSSSLHAPQPEQIEIVDELDELDEEFEIYDDLLGLEPSFVTAPDNEFVVLTTEDSYQGPSDIAIDPEEEYTDCTICGVPVKRKNLSKHIQRIHSPKAENSSPATSNEEEGSNCCGCIVILLILWAMILANS